MMSLFLIFFLFSFITSDCEFIQTGNCQFNTEELPSVKFSCGTPKSETPITNSGFMFKRETRENQDYALQGKIKNKYFSDGVGIYYLFGSYSMETFNLFDQKNRLIGSGVQVYNEGINNGFISICTDETIQEEEQKKEDEKYNYSSTKNKKSQSCSQIEFDCIFGGGENENHLRCNQTEGGSWRYGGLIYGGVFGRVYTNWIINGYITNNDGSETFNITGKGKTTEKGFDVGNYFVLTDEGITHGLLAVAAYKNRAFVNFCVV